MLDKCRMTWFKFSYPIMTLRFQHVSRMEGLWRFDLMKSSDEYQSINDEEETQLHACMQPNFLNFEEILICFPLAPKILHTKRKPMRKVDS